MVYVCIEDFIWALGAKSRYFPPSSLDISNLWSCRDNPEYRVILTEVTVMHWPNKTHDYSTPCMPGRSSFIYLKTHFIIWATESCSFTEKHAMKYLQWLQNNSHMSLDSFCHFLIQGVPIATEPGISLIILKPMKILQRNRHTLQTHSSSFLTKWMYSCSNFVAISSLVLELLKKCRHR